ncbi:MAG: NAD-dependent epimerase/dehydratase family protein [Deltaproteobacteria bacterium]|nr:NAD-dependent epimerase/dehydratase family protein [Deltaproteobacteria bacterium]
MTESEKNILVTGAAGFIGFHLSKRLLETGYAVIGVDNLNPYYDVNLKRARLDILKAHGDFAFYHLDIHDLPGLRQVFRERSVSRVCNLAAQAGVRYSLKDPFSYQKSNVEGFLNLLELAREYGVDNFVYASSSSVYGKNKKIPYGVQDRVDNPISLYAVTKKANELMAHAYSHLFEIPCTGLRYFTVYGPWGRPDMALFLFTDAILNHRPIKVYNYGKMRRDFTYIDDIVDGTIKAIERPAPYEIFNLGNSDSVGLMDFIRTIEEELGQEAEKEMLPLQPGDVPETVADIERSREILGFSPGTPLREGIRRFMAWYREYYRIDA